jgi:hypothetical protein
MKQDTLIWKNGEVTFLLIVMLVVITSRETVAHKNAYSYGLIYKHFRKEIKSGYH